jgi:hypothetical protein
MEILIILWACFAIATAYIASQKGRDPITWAGIGFVGGIFALVAIAVVPAVEK